MKTAHSMPRTENVQYPFTKAVLRFAIVFLSSCDTHKRTSAGWEGASVGRGKDSGWQTMEDAGLSPDKQAAAWSLASKVRNDNVIVDFVGNDVGTSSSLMLHITI